MNKGVKILTIIGVLLVVGGGAFLSGYFLGQSLQLEDDYEETLDLEDMNFVDYYEDIDPENIKLGDMVISEDIVKFSIGREIFAFNVGDSLSVSYWDDEEKEIYFNDNSYEDSPILYGNVTIGTKAEDVISGFNIQSGYANINMEVDTFEEDGTTDIVDIVYEDNSFLEYDYLDACIRFGYKRVDDSWKMINANDLFNLIDSGQTEGLLIFRIDINGLDEEVVKKGEVISIWVDYYN